MTHAAIHRCHVRARSHFGLRGSLTHPTLSRTPAMPPPRYSVRSGAMLIRTHSPEDLAGAVRVLQKAQPPRAQETAGLLAYLASSLMKCASKWHPQAHVRGLRDVAFHLRQEVHPPDHLLIVQLNAAFSLLRHVAHAGWHAGRRGRHAQPAVVGRRRCGKCRPWKPEHA